LDSDDMLAHTAFLERESEHPIAQGIVKKAKERQLTISQVKQFEALT